METCEIEVWVLVNADGEYEVGNDADQAYERFEENCDTSGARRMVKVVLTVPLPVECVLTGTVPAESTEGAALEVA